jgi:hypothetical protein
MDTRKKLLLAPDCPRTRQFVAKRLARERGSGDVVEWRFSLDQVDLAMAIEVVLEKIHR